MSVAAVVALVWALASMDTTFVGFRDSAGRNPRVRKRTFFRTALLRGLLHGQLACVGVLAWIGLLCWTLDAPTVIAQHRQVGIGMVEVYLPSALVVLGALSIYRVHHPDISSLASVLVLGPLTLLRPVVILAGGMWGLWQAPSMATASSVALALSWMLAIEPWLGRRWRRRDPLGPPPGGPL